MKLKFLSLILPAAVFLAGGAAQARVDSELAVTVKYRYQRTAKVTNGVEKGTYGEARLDSKQLLNLIGRDANRSFKSGSKLMITPEGDAYVLSRDGKERTDVSGFLSVEFEDSPVVFGGNRNLESGVANQRLFYPMKVTVNLSSLKATFSGIADEKTVTGKADRTGVQITTSTIQSMAVGTGSYGTGVVFGDGTIQLKGKVAEVVR